MRIEQAHKEIGKRKKYRTPGGELSLNEQQYQKLLFDLRKDFEEQKRAEKKLKKKKKKKHQEEEFEPEPALSSIPGFTEIELDLESQRQKVKYHN